MQRPPSKHQVVQPPQSAQQPAASQREVAEADVLRGRGRQPSGRPKAPPQLPDGPGTRFNFGAFPVMPPARIQAKLMVNEPGDAYEREADEMAERVMGMEEGETAALAEQISTALENVQRQADDSEDSSDNDETDAAEDADLSEESATIQRKSSNTSGGFTAPAIVSAHLNNTRNSGHSMPGSIKNRMERAYGVDFSNVRIHTDAKAVQMNRLIQARAFTYGKNIYFNQGEFSPESASGQHLLAHELAHTLQQNRDLLMRKTSDTAAPNLNQEQMQGDAALDNISTDMASALQSGNPAQTRMAGEKLNAMDIVSRRKIILLIQQKLPEGQKNNIEALLEVAEQTADKSAPPQSPAEPSASLIPKPRQEKAPITLPESAAKTAPQESIKKKSAAQSVQADNNARPEKTSAPSDLSKSVQKETAPDKKQTKATAKDKDAEAEKLPALADLLEPIPVPEEPPAEQEETISELSDVEASLTPETSLTEGVEMEALEADIAAPLEQDEAATLAEQTTDPLAEDTETAPPLDLTPFIESLQTAPEDARTTLEETRKKIEKDISSTAGSSLSAVETQHEKTVDKIESDIEKRKANLKKGADGEEDHIQKTLKTQFDAAAKLGRDWRQNFKDVYANHRITIENAVIDNKYAIDLLHYNQTLKAQQQTTDKAKEARNKGDTKAATYPATGRGRVQKDAAKGVAEKTAQEIEANEPDVLKAIDEVIEPLPEKFDTLGAEALEGYDSGLPDLLKGVDQEVIKAQETLKDQAQDALKALSKINKELNDKLSAIKTAALAKANAIPPQAKAQIQASKQKAISGLNKAGKLANTEIKGIAVEAVDILSNTADPDADKTAAFTQAVLDYIQGLAEETLAAMEAAGEGSTEQIKKVVPPARKGLQAILKEAETQLLDFDKDQTGKLEKLSSAVEKNLADTNTKLDDNFKAAKTEIETELGKAVKALEEKFKTHYKEAEKKITEKIDEGLAKNNEALSKQEGSMNEAASDAAWDYDHPILSTIADIASFILGAIVAILTIIALIVVVIVAIKVLAAAIVVIGVKLGIAALTAAVAATIAKVVIVGGLTLYAVYQGYQAYKMRVAAGEGSGSAFLGVLGDFTGINAIKDGFTKDDLSPYERGKSITEGTITLVTTLLGARGMVKKYISKAPPRLPNPHKPVAKKPPVSTAKPPLKNAPVPPQEPPVNLPKAVEPPPSLTAPKQTPTPKTPTPDKLPATLQSKPVVELPPAPKTTAKPDLKLVPAETPANTNQKPLPISPGTPKPARTPLKLVSSEPNPKLSPPKGNLKAVPTKGKPKTGSGKSTVPEPLPEAQAKPMAKAVGAEGYEPIQIESGVNKPKFQVLEGGMSNQPSGQSSLQVMASGAKKGPGGGGLRPAASGSTGRSVSGGGGGKSVSSGKPTGAVAKPSAGSSTKTPAKPAKTTPAKKKATGTKGAPAKVKPGKTTPAKTKAAGAKTTPAKAKPVKTTPAKPKAAGSKVTPVKAKPKKATPAKTKAAGAKKQKTTPKGGKGATPKSNPQTQAKKQLKQLEKQKSKLELKLKKIQQDRAKLTDEISKAESQRKSAMDQVHKDALQNIGSEKKVDPNKTKQLMQEARDAVDRRDKLKGKLDKKPTGDDIQKQLKQLEADIDRAKIHADPKTHRAGLPCFSGDTMIWAIKGLIPISELKIGDQVYSYDLETETNKLSTVIEIHRNKTYHFYEIKVDGNIIQATGEHPFWVKEKNQWIAARDLQTGMHLFLINGEEVVIEKIDYQETTEQPSFNLSLEFFANYFVGKGVLVHNQNPAPIDLNLGGDKIIYRGTNPKYPGKVYVGQTNENTGVDGRERSHQAEANRELKKLKDLETKNGSLTKKQLEQREFYEFKKDMKLEPIVKGVDANQADYLEQKNIDIESKLNGDDNVMNRREQIKRPTRKQNIEAKIIKKLALQGKTCPP